MKKLLILFTCVTLYSCEQLSEEDVMPSCTSKSPVLFNTQETIPTNFDPLDQLKGIPVNILNIGNTKYKYLSAQSSGNKIVLTNKDDGSLRQRWFIYNSIYNIVLAGGNKNFNILTHYPSVSIYKGSPALMYTMQEKNPISALHNIPGTSYYFIGDGEMILRNELNQQGIEPLYLQCTSSNGTKLAYYTQQSDFAKWEIIPVGEFKVIDIAYAPQTSTLNRNDQLVDEALIDNDRNTGITYHFNIVGSYNVSSNFSKTEGVSVAVTESIKVGIPIVEGIGADVSISSTQTSSKNWTFGRTENKSISIQHSIDVPIPANTKTRIQAYMTSYDTSVTYVATLQNLTDNKIFKVKGTWKGITTTLFYCKTHDEITNQTIAIYEFPIND